MPGIRSFSSYDESLAMYGLRFSIHFFLAHKGTSYVPIVNRSKRPLFAATSWVTCCRSWSSGRVTMLTLMFECELWNSGRSFFRSAIEGLSTAASVMVVWPAPPPPPAPGEHAAPTKAIRSPTTVVARRRSHDRRSLPLIESHPFLNTSDVDARTQVTTLSSDNVVRYNMGGRKLQDGFETPPSGANMLDAVQR